MKYQLWGHTPISILGLGTMRLPLHTANNEISEKTAIDLIKYALDRGINYIDTAFTYHHGNSEEIIGKAIKGTKRDQVILATKCPVWEINAPDDFDKILHLQLKKLNTDYIDCYLFHALGKERWEKVKQLSLLTKMEDAKKKGLIHHIGFSFHDEYNIFKNIVDEYKGWEFCQLQYSYVDTNKQAGTKGIHYAKKNDLKVIVMEPLHGGRLAKPPIQVRNILFDTKSAVEWAFDFLFDQAEVDIVLSGMNTKQQIDENLFYACNASPNMLNSKEREMLKEASRIYHSMSKVLCTGCGYCMPCPNGINIPSIMSVYNKSGSTNYRNAKIEYDNLPTNAKQCKHCKVCEQYCPQMIKISETMSMIAQTFNNSVPPIDENSLKIKWPERYKQYLSSLDINKK